MRSAVAAVLLVCVGQPALAGSLTIEDLNDEERAVVDSFMEGNGLHTLFHEAGHMLVSEFGLPVLGREEDAVDNLASIMLLEAEDDAFDQALIDTADSFWMTNELVKEATAEQEEEDVSAYYDVHSLDLQRSYQVVCLMVGSDPERFSDVADEYDLPQERRESCAFDYEQAVASWDLVLEPHLNDSDDESAGEAITVVYEEPATPGLAYAFAQTRDNRLLERVAESIATRYVLEPGIVFRAKECDTINAFWSPSDREVTYCYELANYYGRQALDWIEWERENPSEKAE